MRSRSAAGGAAWLCAAAALGLLVAGCGLMSLPGSETGPTNDVDAAGAIAAASSPSPQVAPAITPNPDAIPAVETAMVAAQRWLQLPRSALRVVSVTDGNWPTSALGCPEPGLTYGNVERPGYVVVVDGGGKQLEYHVDHQGHLGLCRESSGGS